MTNDSDMPGPKHPPAPCSGAGTDGPCAPGPDPVSVPGSGRDPGSLPASGPDSSPVPGSLPASGPDPVSVPGSGPDSGSIPCSGGNSAIGEAVSSHAETPLDKAERAAADGDFQTVGSLYAPDLAASLSPALRYRWWLLLLQTGCPEPATRLAESLSETDFARRVADIIEADILEAGERAAGPPSGRGPGPAAPDDVEEDLADLPLSDPRERPRLPVTVDLFLRWFAGRRDIHARQWYGERRRRTGYHPVEEPLTAEVARAHLEGRMTVGQYVLFPDGTVSFAVIDLDLRPDALAEVQAAHGRDASPVMHTGLRTYVLRIMETAKGLGLVFWPEDSGGRGVHLWLLLQPRRPARAARALLGTVLSAGGPQPPDVRAEIFPKQDRPGKKGFSSLVKLPLGIHQATLRRCHMLDERLRPIEDPLAALQRLSPPPSDVVDDVLGRRLVPLPAPELECPDLPPPALPTQHTARSLAEALRAIEPGSAERQACESMLGGCAVVRHLVEKAFESRRLDPAEARALVYTIGLVGPSCGLIEDALAAARVSRKELERVRLGLPAPAGCKRLRKLDSDRGKDCRCFSGSKPLPYATPALFAVGTMTPAVPSWKPFAEWIDDDALVPADPLQTIAQRLQAIEERLRRLEPPAALPDSRKGGDINARESHDSGKGGDINGGGQDDSASSGTTGSNGGSHGDANGSKSGG